MTILIQPQWVSCDQSVYGRGTRNGPIAVRTGQTIFHRRQTDPSYNVDLSVQQDGTIASSVRFNELFDQLGQSFMGWRKEDYLATMCNWLGRKFILKIWVAGKYSSSYVVAFYAVIIGQSELL